MQGLVIKSTGSWYHILAEDGITYSCKIRGNFRLRGIKTTNPIAVGDRVIFEKDQLLITEILERKNCLIRKSVNLSKQSHLIAANIDRAYLIVSLYQPRTHIGFIDRFLVSCEAYGLEASLIFNKIDIYDEQALNLLKEYTQIYENIGYPCYITSAKTGQGVEAIKDLLKDKICLFSGNSGVGKSALVNALDKNIDLKVGEISNAHEKGKHTTTFAEMYSLDFGGFLVDTPGIRELGMFNMQTDEISKYFVEIRDLNQPCKFSNCSHEHEPACAVIEAVRAGEISFSRYKSYLNILHGEEVDKPSLLANKLDAKK